jgi:hypothetical protein
MMSFPLILHSMSLDSSIGRIVALSQGHTVNAALVTCDNPGPEGCIVAGDLTKLLADTDAAASNQLSEVASGQIHDSK